MILKQEGNCDCDKIIFLDKEKYKVLPENTILRIYPPGFSSYGSMYYNPNAITIIEPEHIKHNCFESGLYSFVQSWKPNSKTEIKFCYLHICPEVDRIRALACEEDNREELFNLLFELQLAQELTNECPEKACEILDLVKKELNKLESGNYCK